MRDLITGVVVVVGLAALIGAGLTWEDQTNKENYGTPQVISKDSFGNTMMRFWDNGRWHYYTVDQSNKPGPVTTPEDPKVEAD